MKRLDLIEVTGFHSKVAYLKNYDKSMKNQYIYIKHKTLNREAIGYIHDFTSFVTLHSNYDIWDRYNTMEHYYTDYEYYLLNEREQRLYKI